MEPSNRIWPDFENRHYQYSSTQPGKTGLVEYNFYSNQFVDYIKQLNDWQIKK